MLKIHGAPREVQVLLSMGKPTGIADGVELAFGGNSSFLTKAKKGQFVMRKNFEQQDERTLNNSSIDVMIPSLLGCSAYFLLMGRDCSAFSLGAPN